MSGSSQTVAPKGNRLSQSSLDNLVFTMNVLQCSTYNSSSNSKNLANSTNQFVFDLVKSSLANSVCGETAYEKTLSDFSITTGKGSPGKNTYGEYVFNSLDASFSESRCPVNVHGFKSERLIPPNANYTINSKIYQFSFLNDNHDAFATPAQLKVQFDIPFSGSTPPQCAFIKYASSTQEDMSTATISTEGCTSKGTELIGAINVLHCECNHLTDFVAANIKSGSNNPNGTGYAPVESSSSQSTVNVGAIVGGIIGGLALIAIIGGFAYYRRRTEKEEKYQPSDSNGPEQSQPSASNEAKDVTINLPNYIDAPNYSNQPQENPSRSSDFI